MCKLYYVIGTTCSGKDFFMEKAKEQFPHLVGLVQVGKEFRRRYPPDHFQGSGAPDHTEKEAVNIYEEQLTEQMNQGFKHIFIAGQPRRPSQIDLTIGKNPGTVLWMYAPDDVLHQRALGRGDAATVQLSLDRIKNDKIQMFDVLYHLIDEGVHIIPIASCDAEIWINRIVFKEKE